ncbi:hypothetical protein LshimejAT787_0802940 [Lyophyllum shimeji]|uniref:3-carboxymuconate cyclase n=1 Tax=Lyophyllum shimeji TaxID=47721 RepID=A0A9P3PQZ9_LYOSH|nr:hypothetical protein LshimejAT787_0802940 [Lyophyllum shimeji]
MKLSAAVFSALLFSTASAGPLSRRQSNQTQNQNQRAGTPMSPARGSAVGAAYFISNEPTGNQIIAADIGTDGKLTLRRAVDAGGLGAHGNTDPNGPDPLFSQGAIKASSSGNIVATVNAGSNTLAVFKVNPNDPTAITMIGKPVGSGGEFPVSLAINKAGDTVCSLNGGAVNGVNCFKVDQHKGLVPIANTARSLKLNQTTPATGPPGTASHIVFSEDNKQLIASIKGIPPQPGFLAVFDVASDGSLSQDFQSVAPAKGGLLPFSLTVIPGKNAVLATDAGLGFDIFDFARNAGAGNAIAGAGRSSAVAIDGQVATCWSSFSPETQNFYLTDIGTATVTEISVDNNLKGTIVKQYPQGQGSGTIDNDIATVGNNDFMYVLSANATRIDVLSLNAPGKARNIQKLDIAGPARASGVKIDGNNLQGMTTFIKKRVLHTLWPGKTYRELQNAGLVQEERFAKDRRGKVYRHL